MEGGPSLQVQDQLPSRIASEIGTGVSNRLYWACPTTRWGTRLSLTPDSGVLLDTGAHLSSECVGGGSGIGSANLHAEGLRGVERGLGESRVRARHRCRERILRV